MKKRVGPPQRERTPTHRPHKLIKPKPLSAMGAAFFLVPNFFESACPLSDPDAMCVWGYVSVLLVCPLEDDQPSLRLTHHSFRSQAL
jgi:hypothetical protein